jgi:acyl-CoA hydrolase
VTENGVALLRGLDRGARARALIALAHPGHREVLMRAWEKGEGDHEP